ncbi:hypothetical protein OIU77_011210 [Salix suchowensis]|uniref:DUF4283 domain-containing protein n=1 Tax=Salix suchowensis TaxID=1278906 RepID=A0ABQ9AD88_9ROSI|nr:hypothetical protein OIU77_011210 [Salix suchowensis]
MNDSAFVAGASDLCPDGAIIGGKRARTHEVKDCLYRPWKSAITIKLMGKPLNYHFLRERLLQRWKLKGPMTLIDLENNFFIVKFLLDEDMEYVLTRGPWQIVGQYVTTQRFDVLEKIGNLIGHTVKVDSHTMSQARGKFARICVELDISKPLTPFINHGRDNCPLNEKVKAEASEATEPESMIDVHSSNNKVVDIENLVGTRTEQVVGVAVSAGSKTTEECPNLHGQWISYYQPEFSLGVKRATHISAPKKIFGKGKPLVTGKSTHVKTKSVTSKMTDVGTTLVPEHHGSSSMTLDNKTTPLNCVGAVGLQVQGSDFQDDVQGIFSFNVGVPLASPAVLDAVTLPPEHDPADIDSMDVIIDGSASDVQTSISAEHSQAWEALVRSDLDLPNDNDVPPATQRDKTVC